MTHSSDMRVAVPASQDGRRMVRGLLLLGDVWLTYHPDWHPTRETGGHLCWNERDESCHIICRQDERYNRRSLMYPIFLCSLSSDVWAFRRSSAPEAGSLFPLFITHEICCTIGRCYRTKTYDFVVRSNSARFDLLKTDDSQVARSQLLTLMDLKLGDGIRITHEPTSAIYLRPGLEPIVRKKVVYWYLSWFGGLFDEETIVQYEIIRMIIS